MLYRLSMTSVTLRLLAAIAVLLMPLVMSSAPASADLVSPSHAAAAPEAGCDDHHAPTGGPAKANVHCASCVALPVLEAPQEARQAPLSVPALPFPTRWTLGLESEVATPPPKLV
jgi:hypothetical protein